MTRAARDRRVFFVEEPCFDARSGDESVEIRQPQPNVHVVVPHLVDGTSDAATTLKLRDVIDELTRTFEIAPFVLWYWTPMMLAFTKHLAPAATVFDCMDELSAFAGAPAAILREESALIHRADLLFTGGASLYEAKRKKHPRVHAFPSSVDAAHFGRARIITSEPADQRALPHPRIGYFGVIDERIDLDLLDVLAKSQPSWQLVMIGPTAKIDPADLPRHPNIHYLGMKAYAELPDYLSGWDVAMLPFARNDATRYISPTKTPEYLAAGRPVVSTSIRDVVKPYGEMGLVHVGDTPEEFFEAVTAALAEDGDERQRRVDEMLVDRSWDHTWRQMDALIASVTGVHPELTARLAYV